MKCVFVLGPTATGKSQLAIELAEKHNGQIINIDSVQFYKGLEIGSAAPSKDDLQKVPHHLFSYTAAPQEMTAGQYIRDFYQLIEKTKPNTNLFIVGGTGFYIQALEKGMFNLPEVTSEIKQQVLDDLDQHGPEKLFQELKDFDAETLIHPNDHYRLGRASEIKRAFNKKMSDFQNTNNKDALPFPCIKIGLGFSTDDKEKMQDRVQKRTQQMIKDGLIEETKTILAQGHEKWAPLSSVGYLETVQYLKNVITLEQLEPAITQSTMQLIKKQRTWFKRDPSILWSDIFRSETDIVENEVEKFLKQ